MLVCGGIRTDLSGIIESPGYITLSSTSQPDTNISGVNMDDPLTGRMDNVYDESIF